MDALEVTTAEFQDSLPSQVLPVFQFLPVLIIAGIRSWQQLSWRRFY